MGHQSSRFTPLNIAILTVSDTRDEASDTSGQLLKALATEAGHQVIEKRIVKDDIYAIRLAASEWIYSESVQAIISTGGTGFTSRDSTPEALTPLFDKTIEGFGELFRNLSYSEIGTSTIQSRAVAGLANKTIIFAVPGSRNACQTAFDKIIKEQLDSRHSPCNFVGQLER
ncbi:MAG: molybdenum cofactor biosynthesis protein B [Cellvibrionales bacterium]|nr:molybdenum cofactor biosynthesis protein B [Cellvibrionales bacterium]